jgi:hypothetical protein
MDVPLPYDDLCELSIDELNRQPCRCVSCSTCRGTGRLSMEDDYSISCDECDGGITETCDRCQLLSEYEQERDQWA